MSDDVLDYLPASAREIADLVGIEALLKLVNSRGGTRVYVPAKWLAEGELAAILSAEEAAPLIEGRPGELLKIPRCPKLRQLTALHLHRRGVTGPDIARRLYVTEDTVYRWIKAAEGRRGQADLFAAGE